MHSKITTDTPRYDLIMPIVMVRPSKRNSSSTAKVPEELVDAC
jgi:hypothetical protein